MEPYFLQTKKQAKIVAYANEHKELSQEEIAKELGVGRTYVSRTLNIYMPDRPKLPPGGMEAKITREIRNYMESHPGMGAEAIADELGYTKYRVTKAIADMEAARCGRKKKIQEGGTQRHCLKCGEEFTSSWIGHKICDNCKTSMVYQYIPDHMVYVEGHGRA